MRRMRNRAARSDPLSGLTDQENYASSLFAKLGMERRTQAAAYAARIFGDQDHAGQG